MIYMAVQADVPKLTVLLVCCTASYSAALCGIGIGHCLRWPSWGESLFEQLTSRYPQIPDVMERSGSLGLFLAGILPMPLAAATWTAGFFGVSFPYFLLAGCGRSPKIALFVMLSQT